MATVSMYGASDDLIEVAGVVKAVDKVDRDNDPGARDNTAEYCINDEATFLVGGLAKVKAIFDDEGCWAFSVHMLSEDIGFPEWPVRLFQSPNRNHSMELEIDVPDNKADIVRIK